MNDSVIAWNRYAAEYNSKSQFSQELIHTGLALPGIPASCIVKTAKSVLDIGCGNGINTYLMSKIAGVSAVGIDPVKEQIDYAHAAFGGSMLSFMCSDFFDMTNSQNNEFDLVTFFGSLDYIPLNEAFFLKLNSLTHTETRCYIAKFHPIWTTLYANDTDDEICDGSYFDIGRIDSVIFGQNSFRRYHYGIGEMLTIFKNGGWNISTILEPKPDFFNSAFAYKGYDNTPVLGERLKRVPMTIILEFTRG